MTIKFHPAILLSLLLQPTQIMSAPCTQGMGYEFFVNGNCNYDNFKEGFNTYFTDATAMKTAGCSNTVDQEISELFGTAAGADTEAAVDAACKKAAESTARITLHDVTDYAGGSSFVKDYYNGGTFWNTQTETLLHPSDGTTPEQVLKKDAADVNTYYDFARREPFVWPNELTQFNLDECEVKAAQCCWPQDRQANDNNGNCAKAYDTNCVDKDPGDNTDLCMVDLSYAPENNFVDSSGYTFFPGDDNNGEGPIHCHGFAWANDDMDYYTRYKANNLFYVSMYDHMYQRGYVRNIPGAPMCGCVEKMPIVSRSDCTQTNVQEKYVFVKDSGTGFTGKLDQTTLQFQACQGANNKNNDLEAFYQRLVNEGKVSTAQQEVFKKYIVGNNQCQNTINAFIEAKGFTKGYKNDASIWTYFRGEGSLNDKSENHNNNKFNAIEVKEMFENAPHPIVRRVCLDCYNSHKDIYYRRLTPVPATLDLLNLFSHDWFDADNKFNVDFALYSNYYDAVANDESKRWTYCNFNDPGIGFPRDCGPTGYVAWNWNSYYRHSGGRANNHAFYIPTNAEFEFDGKIDGNKNLALGKDAQQISTDWDGDASRAIDGNTVGVYNWNSVTHTNWNKDPWWQVYLGGEATIDDVYVWNRIDCCRERLANFKVELLDGLHGGDVVETRTFSGQPGVQTHFDFGGAKGSTIKVTKISPNNNALLSLAEVMVFGEMLDESNVLTNIARGKPASQISTRYGGAASRAVDGSQASWWSSNSVTHTSWDKPNPWWKVDLEEEHEIKYVTITNRGDCCYHYLTNVDVELLDANGDVIATQNIAGQVPRGNEGSTTLDFDGTLAYGVRVIRNTGTSNGHLMLAEVQVWGQAFYHPTSAPSISMVPSTTPTSAPSASPTAAPTSVGDEALVVLQSYRTDMSSAEKDGIVALAIKTLKKAYSTAAEMFGYSY